MREKKLHLDRVLELLVEVVAGLEGGVELVVHPIMWKIHYSIANSLEWLYVNRIMQLDRYALESSE